MSDGSEPDLRAGRARRGAKQAGTGRNPAEQGASRPRVRRGAPEDVPALPLGPAAKEEQAIATPEPGFELDPTSAPDPAAKPQPRPRRRSAAATPPAPDTAPGTAPDAGPDAGPDSRPDPAPASNPEPRARSARRRAAATAPVSQSAASTTSGTDPAAVSAPAPSVRPATGSAAEAQTGSPLSIPIARKPARPSAAPVPARADTPDLPTPPSPTADPGAPAYAVPPPSPLADPADVPANGPLPPSSPGRALVTTDFREPDVSAGERLIRLAYRLGVPGEALAAPFGRPAKLKLLATVENPLVGDRAAGVALRAGHFLVYGVKAPVAQMDFGPAARLTPPFERVVHGFTWLRDLATAAPRNNAAAAAMRVADAWLAANPRPGKGAAWRVGHAGHRLVAWLTDAPLIFGGTDKARRRRFLQASADTARWLDKRVGRADDRLEEVAGWCGILAAGLLLPDGKPRRLYAESGLVRALGELVGEDGGVLSRSPLGQMEAIALLAQVAACYRAVRRDPPPALDAMLSLLVPPLLGLAHGDGGLGSWQGAGAIGAGRVAALIEASGVRTRPLRDVRQWGYQRAAAGRSVLQFDAAPPPASREARHGCASTLAFEFSHGECRLIVNCGGAAFAGGQIPTRIEQGLRATAAHSTVTLDEANSTAILIGGKLGKGVEEVAVDRRTLDLDGKTATRLEASHDGYVPRHGLTHRRILILRDDGSELRGEDLLEPAGKQGKRGKIGYALRFHIGPGIDLRLAEDGRGAGLALPDGSLWQFRIAAEGEVDAEIALEIEESLWADGDGRAQPIQQLVAQGLIVRSGGRFSWILKKMGQA